MRKLTYILSLIMIFIIPWENVITLPGLGTISRISGMLLAGLWLVMVLMEGKIRKLQLFHFVVGLFVLWNMASILWSVDVNITKSRIITYMQMMLLVLILWDIYQTAETFRAALQAYILGAYVSVVSLIYDSLINVSVHTLGRYSVSGFNENAIALILALGIPVAWRLAITEPEGNINSKSLLRFFKFANLTYVPAAFLAIVLTGTRGAFIATFPALLYIILSLGRFRIYQRILLLLVMSALVVAIFPHLPELPLERLGSIGEAISTGNLNKRTMIWHEGFDILARYPLTGVGSGAFPSAVASHIEAHNFAVSILGELGFIGFSLFVIILSIIFWQIKHQPKWEFRFWLAVLLVWMIGASSTNFMQRKQTWFFLSMIFISSTVRCTLSGSSEFEEKEKNFGSKQLEVINEKKR